MAGDLVLCNPLVDSQAAHTLHCWMSFTEPQEFEVPMKLVWKCALLTLHHCGGLCHYQPHQKTTRQSRKKKVEDRGGLDIIQNICIMPNVNKVVVAHHFEYSKQIVNDSKTR